MYTFCKGLLTHRAMSGASLVEGNPGLHSSPSQRCLLFKLPLYHSHFPNWQTYIAVQCIVRKGGEVTQSRSAAAKTGFGERAVQCSAGWGWWGANLRLGWDCIVGWRGDGTKRWGAKLPAATVGERKPNSEEDSLRGRSTRSSTERKLSGRRRMRKISF